MARCRSRLYNNVSGPDSIAVSFQDITGLFSRYFVTGFVLPVFFGCVALFTGLHTDWIPAIYRRSSPTTRLLILVGAAVLAALLLLGLRTPVIRLFEGYPIERMGRRGPRPRRRGLGWLDHVPSPLRPSRWAHALYTYMHRREEERLQLLQDRSAKGDLSAARELDRSYPLHHDRLPTRLGNVIRAYEYYATSRWDLESLTVWPRLAALMSDRERDFHIEAETDFIFLLNASLTAWVVGAVLTADMTVHWSFAASDLWRLVPLALAYPLYRLSLEAARRWGAEIRVSVDLHRLELYERIGLKRPASPGEEREMARELSAFLANGGELSPKWWNPSPGTPGA